MERAWLRTDSQKQIVVIVPGAFLIGDAIVLAIDLLDERIQFEVNMIFAEKTLWLCVEPGRVDAGAEKICEKAGVEWHFRLGRYTENVILWG